MTRLQTMIDKARDWASSGSLRTEGESGQGLAEYGLILAFIALVCLAALGALGSAISSSPGFSIF